MLLHASSTYVPLKGILTVSSGIETADYRALDEILHQLQEDPGRPLGALGAGGPAPCAKRPDLRWEIPRVPWRTTAWGWPTGQSPDLETMQRLLDQVTPGASVPPPAA